MENVYLVELGERNEGGYIVAVHLSRTNAVEVALKCRTCFAGGWIPDPNDDYAWENGCDYVRVYRMEVAD